MPHHRRPQHTAVPAAHHHATGPVFANDSGARWRRVRVAAALVAVTIAGLLTVAVPHVLASPALPTGQTPEPPTPAEIGEPPVVGTGPLVHLVRLVEGDGATYGLDPFTDEVLAELTADEAAAAAEATYALHRYGYSESPARTISLTFDDGPDPVWTPRLLDLLSRHGVPATFFVTGQEMARHPEILRRMVREGFAVGNHTLTHIDVDDATPFRQQLELVLTDRILRGLTGTYSSYVRLPYESADPEAVQDDVAGILRAQQLGYVVASHDFDTLDWAYASGQKTGDIPLPPLGQQDDITVLLHDAGGDRAQTLQYVEDLIDAARAAGYTFTSMPQAHPEIAERTGAAEVGPSDRIAVLVAGAFYVLPQNLLFWLFVLALVSMIGLGLLNTTLALVRARLVRRRGAGEGTMLAPGVSVLIAAFNEEVVIGRTLEHVLAGEYPVSEVVVVDDGSTDGTAAAVLAVAARDSRVRLVQQPNAGKWAALNRGMRTVGQPVVVTLDADTIFLPDTITNLVARFRSPSVGAVAGVIKVGNRSRNVLTRWQALEYLTQIGVERAAAALLDGIMVVPGACAAWRRTAVLQAGGYTDATLAEDCDLTLMLHQHGWRVEQADDAVAWTEAPETLDALLKQRIRWTFGTFQAVWRHRNMLLRPRYGWLGMLTMPVTVLALVVPLLFTPLVVVVIVQTLVEHGLLTVLLYFGLFALIYGVLAAVAVALLRERPAHLLMVPLYRVIYEPLRAYLLYASVGTAIRGIRLGWNKLARTAHLDAAPTPETPPPAVPPPAVAPLQPVPAIRRPAERAEVPA